MLIWEPHTPQQRNTSTSTTVFGQISAVERAGLSGLPEGQKVSYEIKVDPKRGKSSAENL
jgi:cold shock CspA family protein